MARVTQVSRAAVLAVGSELLTPSKVDTNSLFITEQLNLLGIDVVAKAVVGDDRVDMAHVFQAMLERADLLVTSGGLGPTDDDVTRDVVADVLGRPLAEDPALVAQLRKRFAARGLPQPMPAINLRQAMVPSGAVPIENTVGSAPGLWFELDRQYVLLLPGPPPELQPMLAAVIAERLVSRASGSPILRRVLRVSGQVESYVDQTLQSLYQEWARVPIVVRATILAAPGAVELHLSARAPTRESAGAALDAAVARASALLGPDVYSTDGRSLEHVVGDLLVDRRWRIGVAESCTGGLVASRLTDVPGSSRYLDAGVVAYANAVKTDLLDVPADLIHTHGAVSEVVALAMAEGVRSRARADVGLGVTGIAGPHGGTPDKPVGTVAIAVVTAAVSRCRVFRFRGDRQQVKFQASQAALDSVRRALTDG
jgi:nicotinamide-nucleotide amidase